MDVAADDGTYFHHGLVHFGFHLLLQFGLPVFHDARHVGAQLPRHRVYRLELFFYA